MEHQFRKKWEVIVVGGGFVGNYVAKHLTDRGIETCVLEEHGDIGTPRHCAGLISISGLEKLQLEKKIRKKNAIQHKIRNAILTGYGGEIKKKITRETPVAYVVNRVKLDKLVYRQAKEKGATYYLNSRVTKIEKNGKVHVRLNGIEKILKAEIIVDAEGASRTLIRSFPGVNLTHRLPGFQMDVKTEERLLPKNSVELIFNVPDFFSWVIPLGNNVYRFGSATWAWRHNLQSILLKLIKKRTKNCKKLREFGGLVLTGGPMKRSVWNNIIVIGDAAGWSKPTTGGGVVFGGLIAKMAAKKIDDVLHKDQSLASFEQLKGSYKKQFKMMRLVREVLNVLGPGGIQVLLKLLPQQIFTKLEGDYDLQFKAILKLLFPLLRLF